MKFSYSVIGDNTQENREWLEMLGYKPFMWDAYDDDQPFITTMDSGEYTSASKDDRHHYMCSLDINCIGNPQLFQAVSAIREGTDIMQYFTNGVHWYLCESVRFANSELMEIDRGGSDYWKATLTELQEKFKL